MDGAAASEGWLPSEPARPVAAGRIHQQEFRLSDVKTLDSTGFEEIESVAQIVSLARSGNPEAFRAIFQRYGKPILAFIYHLLGDRSHAEELTQETFLRAYRGLDRMQDSVRLSTWLFGIARNVVREAIRNKQRRHREIGMDDLASLTIQDDRAGPAESFMTEELQRAIRRCFDRLSDDQRVVFVLKMLCKIRYHEISIITGSSIGKLKTDLHRARQQMRESLRPYLVGRVSGI